MDSDRVKKALDLFNNGYNCSQAVFVAYADLFEMDEQQALKISTSFGGGIGGMGETCGTVMGMSMIAGLVNGVAKPHDADGKATNYNTVQFLAGEFKKEHSSLLCKELKDTVANNTNKEGERPCSLYVRSCAVLIEKHLLKV